MGGAINRRELRRGTAHREGWGGGTKIEVKGMIEARGRLALRKKVHEETFRDM